MNRRYIRKVGYTLVLPEGVDEPLPLACPVCSLVMGDRSDHAAFRRFECCAWCELMWARGREARWADGWRPDPTVVRDALSGLCMTRRPG